MIGRAPDFIIGTPDDPYLRRWWIIPRNRWFNIYLHQILRPDDDRALHDHPWFNCSIVLRGGYWEMTPTARRGALIHHWRGARAVVFRRASSAHRLEPIIGGCWTLFITGPVIRVWGFHCPQGWVRWDKFTKAGAPGEIGPGCGE